MHEARAARDETRRSCEGGVRAPFARRARGFARVLFVAATLGLPAHGPIMTAHAAGSPAGTPLPQVRLPAHATPVAQGSPAASAPPVAPTQPRATIPGFHGPPPNSDTSVSGIVRAAPAHMPFYTATKGTTTIYVLGTLHIGDPSDYPPNAPFRRPILAALAASPTLALELSPDDLIESQDDVSRYGVCSYACLPRLLPDPLWRKLAARLQDNPAALEEIKKTRPWLAALLVETYDSLNAGLQTEYGTEAQLQNIYLRTRGKVAGLETLAEQMRAFTNLTLAEQREMLAQDLEQTPAQNVADVKELHRLWRAGDADAIAAWASAKSERLARTEWTARALDNRIVYDRNRRFTARMLLIAGPNRPVFVAIGALHLGGPKGVLALLRTHGFVVEAN